MGKKNTACFQTTNTQEVLHCIVENRATTRADIAKKLQLSKPTVSKIVKQLLTEDWIYEIGGRNASADGGRKPVELAFHAQRSFIIGIDIGGTNVLLGITDLNGKVLAYRHFPTQTHLHKDLFAKIERCVEAMKTQLAIHDTDILGMGVGVPGVTDVHKGVVLEAPVLNWKRFPVRAALEEIFAFPIYVDNDVNSAVLGEYWQGGVRDKANLIYIAIGTGIGSGMILNGDLYRGSNYTAGEIGYVVTDRRQVKETQSVFTGYGFLESVAGGSAISYQLSNRLDKTVTSKEAFELYEKHDKDAIAVIEPAIEHLAIGIANYVSLFDPEIIILGGGVSQSFSMIGEQLVAIMEKYTPQCCAVVQTALGEEAGIVGAAALFLKEHDEILNI